MKSDKMQKLSNKWKRFVFAYNKLNLKFQCKQVICKVFKWMWHGRYEVIKDGKSVSWIWKCLDKENSCHQRNWNFEMERRKGWR